LGDVAQLTPLSILTPFSIHASLYLKATYQHLETWFDELREGAGKIPCICVANKIDMNYKVTSKSFNFPEQRNLPFFFVSAADGTNVVKVFEQAVEEAVGHRDKWVLCPPPLFFKVLSSLHQSSADEAGLVYWIPSLARRRAFLLLHCFSGRRRFSRRVKAAVARGEYSGGAAGEMEFMAEVRDALKYFDDKETA